MTTDTGRRAEPALGRKQDTDRTEAILAAAGEALLEMGYDNLRIQDVADRAGAGTGAIYRRWKNKEALIAEVIRSGCEPPFADSDDPADALASVVRVKAQMAADRPDLLPGLISAMRSNELINEAMQDEYTVEPIRERFARLLGDDHPDLDILAEIIPALALHRTIFGKQPIDADAFADEMLSVLDNMTGGALSS